MLEIKLDMLSQKCFAKASTCVFYQYFNGRIFTNTTKFQMYPLFWWNKQKVFWWNWQKISHNENALYKTVDYIWITLMEKNPYYNYVKPGNKNQMLFPYPYIEKMASILSK